MKYVYEANVYFDYPRHLSGMLTTKTYLVEAGSARVAAGLAQAEAARDRNGGYAPRITRLQEIGSIDAG